MYLYIEDFFYGSIDGSNVLENALVALLEMMAS
jgi:hypothetical protein